ncbi:hypothetical protein [Lactobacillus crispatus]|uniref:hypothetical protein n=1 Tax=Lactobacillus crispatus TaxID=47770 RepID=UPI00254E9B10|nr:hypothetical protein [Lactobacillus crispatus]MDK7330564.1 hypothetical protein [Lactobacillus crispatus]MDK7343609.1 hypothetical protein [Lactobacillus crispatus]
MDKFKDTIITDAGRKLLINVGAGNGEIAYTRAVLAGQDVSSMADEDTFESLPPLKIKKWRST